MTKVEGEPVRPMGIPSSFLVETTHFYRVSRLQICFVRSKLKFYDFYFEPNPNINV